MQDQQDLPVVDQGRHLRVAPDVPDDLEVAGPGETRDQLPGRSAPVLVVDGHGRLIEIEARRKPENQ